MRTCVDRLAGDGEHTIATELNEEESAGCMRSRFAMPRASLRPSRSRSNTAASRACRRSASRSERYPALDLTVLYAQEREEPKHRPRIDWKLISNLPVHAHDDAIEKLDWYAMRWKIETFHKILKSGCKAEAARLRTVERLVKPIAVFCILAWRMFCMTMINRSQPHAKPDLAITYVEMKLLDHLLPDKDPTTSHAGTVSSYLVKIARWSRSRDWVAISRVPATRRRQHRHVARPYAPYGHRARRNHQSRTYG